MSTLRKTEVEKHGDHDQSSHGGEGDDSEGEFEDSDYDDPKWMDTMDYPRKKK